MFTRPNSWTMHSNVEYVTKQDTGRTHVHRQKKIAKNKKGQARKIKGWQPFDPYLSEEEVEETTENPPNQIEGDALVHNGITTCMQNDTKSKEF